MKLIGLMLARNEAHEIGLTARAALMWCDALVILLHACTDDTPAIVEQIVRENERGRVLVNHHGDPVWQEMAMRQHMLEMARAAGATHIAYVDADEVLTGNLLGADMRIGNVNIGGPPAHILQLPWVCLARSLDRYYAAGPWYDSWVSTTFRDSPELHWSSESRGGYDFHHREPFGRTLAPYRPIQQSANPAQHQGGLMHLQFVSERRLRAKQALYKLTEVIRWPGRDPIAVINRRYDLAVYQSDPAKVATAECPASWWEPYAHLMKHLDMDAVPWQEAQMRRLIAEHGVEKFAGLDLFGTV